MKGCLNDNAFVEATFKIIKAEFVKGQYFETLNDLKFQLADYVNWSTVDNQIIIFILF